MKYQNIVVAIDGSQPAEKAFRKAIEIAKRNQARLILAHVIDDRRVGRVEIYSPTFFKKLEEKMRRILSDINWRQKIKAFQLLKFVWNSAPRKRK